MLAYATCLLKETILISFAVERHNEESVIHAFIQGCSFEFLLHNNVKGYWYDDIYFVNSKFSATATEQANN